MKMIDAAQNLDISIPPSTDQWRAPEAGVVDQSAPASPSQQKCDCGKYDRCSFPYCEVD